MRTWRIAELLEVSADYLRGRGCSSPRLDAELLLAEVLAVGRIDLYTQYDRPVDVVEVDAYRELIARRAKREPVAYILGRAPFRYLTLKVTPATLIPRPETEELVDAVLDRMRTHPVLERGAVRVVDVGTGSGAIALSLASEAGLCVLGVDSSEAALAVAAENAAASSVGDKITLRRGDLLDGVAPRSLQVVVANLPYVPEGLRPRLDPDVVDFEPGSALFAGADGLDEIRRLLPQAALALEPGGALFLEVGGRQAQRVAEAARAEGFFEAEVIRDLSGKERIVRATMPGCPVLDVAALDEGDLDRLRAGLRDGAILGLPTDTVYGLAAAWDSTKGVARLFEAKGRGEERPVGALFASVAQAREALPDLDPLCAAVLERLLPGPYTFVVGTGVARPRLVGTEDSLGVRVPDHPRLLETLALVGLPLALTSANKSGEDDVAQARDVDAPLLSWCAVAFDGSGVAAGVASTVVDLRPLADDGDALVLREGAVSADEAVREAAAAADIWRRSMLGRTRDQEAQAAHGEVVHRQTEGPS